MATYRLAAGQYHEIRIRDGIGEITRNYVKGDIIRNLDEETAKSFPGKFERVFTEREIDAMEAARAADAKDGGKIPGEDGKPKGKTGELNPNDAPNQQPA